MRSACLIVLFAATIASAIAGAQAPAAARISRTDAIADLGALFDAIERIHPAPYANRSRELVAADGRQLGETLPETMTRAEWWTRVARIVATLADGHTEVPPPIGFLDGIAALYRSGARPANTTRVLEMIHQFPPGSVAAHDGHLIVTSPTLADGFHRGDRLLSINGTNADQLLVDWTRETSGDSEANQIASVEVRLTDLLAAHGIVSPYRVTIASGDGSERTGVADGPTMQSLIDARRGGSPNFAYRLLEPGIGYMDFYSMGGDYGRFKTALASIFRRVAADNVRTLIVDVRNNMGGYSQSGDELLRYVTQKPFRSWSRQEIKRSRELRAQGEIALPFRLWPLKYLFPDPRRIYAGKLGSIAAWTEDAPKAPRRATPFFAGPVCVLTGARTFSAAVAFADAVKTYRLATLVGEETGGRANMTMEPVGYLLPRTKLVVSIAAGRTVRANGDATDTHGVLPDIVVKPTTDDIRAGRDPVIDRARDCPRIQ